MLLYIDTTDNKKTILKLGDTQIVKTYKSPRSQDLLGLISKLLKSENKTPADLTAIKVNLGPGAFTSLRVGVAVANALAFGLNIPVNGRKQPVFPHYGKPPSITKSKSA